MSPQLGFEMDGKLTIPSKLSDVTADWLAELIYSSPQFETPKPEDDANHGITSLKVNSAPNSSVVHSSPN